MFRVDFNNAVMKETTSRLMKQPTLPNISSLTFFKVSHQWTIFPSVRDKLSLSIQVFPFCVVIDPEMRISKLGPSLQNMFIADACIIGRHITDVFSLIRPDILHIEWEKVCASLFVFSSRLCV
jgi:hypothetical protein